MPLRAASSAIRAKSSSEISAPVGLPGELMMIPRVRGVNAAWSFANCESRYYGVVRPIDHGHIPRSLVANEGKIVFRFCTDRCASNCDVTNKYSPAFPSHPAAVHLEGQLSK